MEDVEQAEMTVRIVTEYCGRGDYRVQVIVDGVAEAILPATCGTVTRVRNRQIARWRHSTEDVEFNEVPKAWDMVDRNRAQ